MSEPYNTAEPQRAEIDSMRGAVVLEFGTDWCGYCRAAQPIIAEAFAQYPQVPRLKVEDGPGRPLGRSFRVKLWPTLIFMRDGKEVARTVRPTSLHSVSEALEKIVG
ncbi:MAG: thioredoxin family protein [Spongiibacteraceae bacterium]